MKIPVELKVILSVLALGVLIFFVVKDAAENTNQTQEINNDGRIELLHSYKQIKIYRIDTKEYIIVSPGSGAVAITEHTSE